MNVFVDGSGWNGEESKYCLVWREDGTKTNLDVQVFWTDKKLSSNEAEYYAIIEALKFARAGDRIFSDSKLAVCQIKGEWRCNHLHLINLRNIARKLLRDHVDIIWLHREDNVAGKVLEYIHDMKRLNRDRFG